MDSSGCNYTVMESFSLFSLILLLAFVFLRDSHLLNIHLQLSFLIILANNLDFLTINFLPSPGSLRSTATEIIGCFSLEDWHAHYKT